MEHRFWIREGKWKILDWINRLNPWAGRRASYAVWVAACFILIRACKPLREGHVQVDILMIGRSPRVRALFDIIFYGTLPIRCAALSFEGWKILQESMFRTEKDDSALANPLWSVKLRLAIAAVLFSLQVFAEFVRVGQGAMSTSTSPAPFPGWWSI